MKIMNGIEDNQIIGIIGGTGLGDSLAKRIVDGKLVSVETPFGKPADKILVGTLGNNRKIAFLNRHGDGHKFPPSKVRSLVLHAGCLVTIFLEVIFIVISSLIILF
jgi:5'-methylthioadenosine phosphorylase